MIGRTSSQQRVRSSSPQPPQVPQLLVDWGSLALRQGSLETNSHQGDSGMGARMPLLPRLVDVLVSDALDEDAPFGA